jgi:carboxyl-terminal processing protease
VKPGVKIAVFVGALAAGLFVGLNWRNLRALKAPSIQPVAKMMGLGESDSTQSASQIFISNYDRISDQYGGKVEGRDLKYAGMSGLLASLGDPHTIFMSPTFATEFSTETKGRFTGIGARLGGDPLGARIATVFENGPAFKAGLRPQDVVTNVDGKPVTGQSTDEIVSKIRGPEGTVVKLTVVRAKSDAPLQFSIKRAAIETPTVEGTYVPSNGFGVLTVSQFSEPTFDQFVRELDKLEEKKIKGLVIDMRGNPGGLLQTAVEMLSLFVENKTVIKMVKREGKDETAETPSGLVRDFKYPIVCLVNEDSASAAEIFTGALKDYGRVTIVGTHTYGKASVQEPFTLVDSALAKITIARYLLPSGRNIERKVDEDGVYISGGLEPDVKVEFDDSNDKARFGDPLTDNQLRKAFDVLKSKQ